ncbi:MAG: isopenicillin N synthase family oxygenase [Polyangiaceae bacterium]|jgi:isopenicillin N synthase-like dioxygenase|nr:isopenicillin N synthase family oxygenase [Polyangiaceae bacterium]MBK8940029.1 isopenicillin N synthase family oxygenase [Polyangiaceae bacterium]
MSDVLPVVDFRQLAGDEGERDAFARAFVDGLVTYGFGVVAEHPIAPARIARAFELCEAFFAQPEADKRTLIVPESDGNRGYVPFGGERAVGAAVPDLKEFFHVGQDRPAAGSALSPNVWPASISGFREELTALYRDLEATARALLGALGSALGLPPEHLSAMIDGGDSVLRLIHYPPVPGDAAPGAVRAGAHEDINLITLLAEGTTGGLELKRKDGSWMPVRSLRGQLVINAGDMLQRLTHGRIRSTPHRVSNPSGPNVSRYSIPFFTHPRPDVLLEPMPPAAGWDGPAMTAITAGTFLKERLQAIKAG